MTTIKKQEAIQLIKNFNPEVLGLIKVVTATRDGRFSDMWSVKNSTTEIPSMGIGVFSTDNAKLLISILEKHFGVSFDTPLECGGWFLDTRTGDSVRTFGDVFNKTRATPYCVWREWLTK